MKKLVLLSMALFTAVAHSQESNDKKAVHAFAERLNNYIDVSSELGARIGPNTTPDEMHALIGQIEDKTREMAEGKEGCQLLPDIRLKDECASIFIDYANLYKNLKIGDDDAMMGFFDDLIDIAMRMESFGNALYKKYPDYVEVREDGIYPINK